MGLVNQNNNKSKSSCLDVAPVVYKSLGLPQHRSEVD